MGLKRVAVRQGNGIKRETYKQNKEEKGEMDRSK